MTARSALVFGKDERDAIRVSGEHPDFDVIPVMPNGKLTGYFERECQRARNI